MHVCRLRTDIGTGRVSRQHAAYPVSFQSRLLELWQGRQYCHHFGLVASERYIDGMPASGVTENQLATAEVCPQPHDACFIVRKARH
jgi:hypothetical protein